MKYRALWGLALAGVVLHLLGLGIDAWMHANDPTLAAREGIFTLSNPSHAMIIAGVALTASAVVGMALVWAGDRNVGGSGATGAVLRASALPVLGLAAAGSIWLTSLAESNTSHSHGEAAHAHDDHSDIPVDAWVLARVPAFASQSAAGHSHDTPTAAAAAPTEAMDEGNAHTHGTELAVTADQLVAAANFAQQVKIQTAKYEDIRVAMKDGYAQITQDLPGIAAHFINGKYNSDGVLMDPAHPEILLYTKRLDGNWRLVGAMYSSEKVSDTPPSFFGPIDVWHRHENLCFTAASVSVQPNQAACGGVFVKTTPWNLHVWTADGADGIFAHDYKPISPGAFPGATRPASQDLVVRP